MCLTARLTGDGKYLTAVGTVVMPRHCTTLHRCNTYIQQWSPEHPRGLLTRGTEGLE